jgi:hypothetical protein
MTTFQLPRRVLVTLAAVRVHVDQGYQAGRHLDRRDGVVHVARAEGLAVTHVEEDPVPPKLASSLMVTKSITKLPSGSPAACPNA